MAKKVNIPKNECPTCPEYFDTDCVISKEGYTKIGLTSNQSMTRVIGKIVKRLSYLGTKILKDYSETSAQTGEKWIDGSSVYRVVVPIENTTGVLAPITINLSSLSISEVLNLEYVNTSNNITNNRQIDYDKTTFDLISDVEATTKNYIIIKYV